VKAFKGRSSCLLRRKFPELLKLPSLWTNSYFYSTAGQVSADVIKRYIIRITVKYQSVQSHTCVICAQPRQHSFS
ncbi:transposase, partial [Cylindrospermopsis raciborskii]|uniref:transposase n=1 Tax=Cylindrospermopsis raciborskii TaxID=77022 RepID=UPI00387A0E4C